MTEHLFAGPKWDQDCKEPEQFTKENVAPQPQCNQQPTPTEIHVMLSPGCSGNHGKGWRAKDLGVSDEGRKKSEERFKSLLCKDAKELKECLAACLDAPDAHKERGCKGSFEKQCSNHNPVLHASSAVA